MDNVIKRSQQIREVLADPVARDCLSEHELTELKAEYRELLLKSKIVL